MDVLSAQPLATRPKSATDAAATARAAQALAEEMAGAAEALRAEREALIGQRETVPVEVGDRVRIPRFDVTGDVVAVSRSDDTCAVQAGQVRITCRASEVELLEKAASCVPG